ncbi:diguanylate cyclase domain-containing protein [Ahrensia sp. R2A130]|uniref:diguanylate cyclase domain-containing protein n=1 Tax=Ahrensia sp. R2A130 TaxID=744979 RepID=UPI0001E09C42|nr:diguanylate cyclase [Ahrensia sp. R2A130]EFL89620.1 putative kinase/esterase protein [Ahrensia sp. R2A130]
MRTPQYASRLIYMFSATAMAIFVVCGFLLLGAAGSIADDVHDRDVKRLVSNAVQQQIRIVARDQSQVSNWADTNDAFGETINMEFVTENMSGWLYPDFQIKRTIILGPEGETRLNIDQTRTTEPDKAATTIAAVQDLIGSARQLWMERREPEGNGYTVPEDATRRGAELYAADIRMVDGQVSVVVAQGLVPDDGRVMSADNPHIMVTVRHLTPAIFDAMSEAMGIEQFALVRNTSKVGEGLKQLPVGSSNVIARWQASPPSTTIWRSSLPLIGVILLIVSSALGFLSYRHSKTISALQRSEDENRFLALHDALTGLPNRLQFDRSLEGVISSGGIGRCAILCIDLDRFKAVNDTFGHQAGDAVLAEVANRITQVVGDTGMAARLGGDEFMVLLHDGADDASVVETSQTIIDSVSREIMFPGGSAFIGASIGVAHWPDDTSTAKSIIRSADEALYQAKESGRGRVCLSTNDAPLAPVLVNEKVERAAA